MQNIRPNDQVPTSKQTEQLPKSKLALTALYLVAVAVLFQGARSLHSTLTGQSSSPSAMQFGFTEFLAIGIATTLFAFLRGSQPQISTPPEALTVEPNTEPAPTPVRWFGDNGTPLHQAAFYGNLEAMRELLEGGTPTDCETDVRITPLHLARDPEITQLLLAYQADPNKTDIFGNTPLHYAIDHDTPETVELLLDYKADFNKKNNFGYTPLERALQEGCLEIASKLLQAGAGFDQQEAVIAAAAGNPDLQEKLRQFFLDNADPIKEPAEDLV